jgi:DNA-binding CsgD family transcriptional regulator
LAAAAAAAADGGLHDWAGALARRAAEHLEDPVDRARLALIEAALADAENRPDRAVQLLHQPAVAVADRDPGLAADMLTWIVEAGWAARDLASVRWAVAAVDRLGLTGAGHVLALADVVTEQLDDSFRARPMAPPPSAPICALPESPRGQTKMARWSLALGDHRRAHELATAAERTARARGELGVLPDALAVLATTRWHLGQPRDACAAADEGLRVARDVGLTRSVDTLAAALAQLAAATGDEVRTEKALAEIGGRLFPAAAGTARSLLDLGAGRFDAAADRLTDLIAGAAAPEVRSWLPDLVEAAARAGRPEQAAAAARRFARWADRVDLPWAHALALRCAALTTDGPAAGELFAEAVAVHRSEVVPEPDPSFGARPRESRPFERARTELLYGEWLRRDRRRTAARAPLRSACETFDDLGATPWADRARAELRATGESRADPPPDGRFALTPQELQVVRLAASGLSNREIGAQLFLSPRTVGYHLHKAFPKLGVASRAQLGGLDLPA